MHPLFNLLFIPSVEVIVVKYGLDEIFKGAELDELFNEKNELYPNFSMVPQKSI